MAINPSDFLDLNSTLNQEQKLVVEMVRQFVDQTFRPHLRTAYEEGTFPTEIIPKLGELGLLGAQLKGYGCSGLDSLSYGLIMKELERGDSGLRSFASVQG
ncbi:MAG: acyl-CoA dehydrogenase family protein, partial [Silvanigrellaceae bacterium]